MLKTRRSIRKYTDEDFDITNIIDTALHSPSSKNRQPWDMIVIDDKELITKLANCRTSYDQMIASAKKVIVVVGDLTKHPDDLWIEDCSCLITTIHYQAHLENIGSCWVQVRNRMHDETTTASEYISRLLEIPNTHTVHSLITLGKSAESKEMRELDYSKVHYNKF